MKKEEKKSLYLGIVWLVIASSGVVTIEPAPVDIGIMFLFVMGLFYSRISIRRSILSLYTLLFLFVFSNVFSIFIAHDKILGVKYMTITLYLILSWLFFISLVNNYGEKAVKTIFSGYTVAALFSSVLGILSYFKLIPSYEQFLKFERATGLFKDPNVYGPFMIPVALYALVRLEVTRGVHRIYWLSVLLLTSIGVLLSYSRAAWGSYVLAIGVYAGIRFFINPSLKKVKRWVLFLGIIAILAIALMRIPHLHQDITNRLAYQNYDNQRFANQGKALEIAIKSPLGIGPGQSEKVLDISTHNSYLRVWIENGYLGLICYVIFIVSSIFRGLKCALKTKNAIYAMATAALMAIVLNSFVVDVVHWRHFWLILAVPWFPPGTVAEKNHQ
ncbi:O-antigen ligase family protein [Peribacillus frigoritolerans]|uniref:O-antigen ligase family protein n=1 Tax=Peribacillus frigoritolerans TaxID=450367 RepID=UPI003F86E502